MDIKVDLYCVCWNELKILPFVIQYWKRFVRHAYVYDNGSNDGTIEYLNQFDWITVRHFDSDGINEMAYLNIKNNAWKNNDADYVVVCDVDECLYSNNMDQFFNMLHDNNVSVYTPQWVECYSKEFPTYDEEQLCHELIGGGVVRDDGHLHKSIVFSPKKIKEINYTVGCHFCRPSGEGYSKTGRQAYLIHLKHIGFEYVCDRFEQLKNRLSDFNKSHGFGYHYITCDREAMKKEFDENIPKIEKIV